ncbi:hypothetical protein EC991_000450 [Linnemannia zychae]|nr:hypothetical protein EC991_000450 [Linnemannia zychae]
MLATNSINGASKASSASTRTLNQTEHHPPAPLPRLVAVNSTINSNNNLNTYSAQRTRSLRSAKNKPLTITTQTSTGSGSIAQMQVGTGANGGNGQDVYTPVRTPRSGSVRRKPVAVVPCSPTVIKPLQSRIHPDIAAASSKERAVRVSNGDCEMTDRSYSAAPTNNSSNITAKHGSPTQSSVHGSGESLSSSRSIGSAPGGSGSKRKISSGSPRSKSGGNMGQRFGEFLAISGSLLGSKKRGSDTSIKSASGSSSEPASSSSSSSISSLTETSCSSINTGMSSGGDGKSVKTTGTMLFSKKESLVSSTSPKTPKSSLLSSIFSPDSSRHQQQQQQHLPYSPSRSLHHHSGGTKESSNNPSSLPMDHEMGHDYGYPAGQLDSGSTRGKPHNSSSWHVIDDDKIVNWELNKTVPTSYYEDEAFGLWIRPNHEARTTISGADVEKAEKDGTLGGGCGRDTYNYPGAGTQKKNRPELEDMEVLEEVLDFSLKDYQDYVMADIGCAIQAMNEIYDQQERPFGHPDNFARDTKPRSGARSPPVVMPPNRITQNNINGSANSGSKASSHQNSPMQRINTTHGGPNFNGSSLHIQSPQKQPANSQQQQTLLTPSLASSPFKKHRRHTSVPGGRPTISSMITSIKQSIPSPISLHSAHSTKSIEGGFNHPYYSSYPDGTPFLSGFPAGAPTSYSQADSAESHHHQSIPHSFTSSFLSTNSGGGYSSANSNHSGSSYYSFTSTGSGPGSGGGSGGGGGFLPQSIQTVINSFRHSAIGGGASGNTTGGNPLLSSPSSQFIAHPPNLAISPVPLSKQEEKRLHLENQWRVDIMRRKAHLRGWACRAFMNLYEFSLQSAASSLQEEFRDLYRIVRAIVEVDATATEKSHEVLAMVLAQAQECEREPFQLRYSQYATPAPTGKEIREANEEAIRRFEAAYMDEEYKEPAARVLREVSRGQDQGSFQSSLYSVDHDDRVAPLKSVIPGMSERVCGERSPRSSTSSSSSSSSARTPSLTSCSSTTSSPTTLITPCHSSAYENMDLFGLQRHPVWDPLMDRLTKFDTTHHELDARNVLHFFRRMSLDSPSVSEPPCQYLLGDEERDELLAVLWVLEKCVRERPDAQQSPTWFRLSSSASAVQTVFQAGGVIPYLKELQRKDSKKRDPIQTVHPVTLTGYFKRLLKDCGGLLLKETTALFVELARPATDNGDFWNLEKLSRIDRALLYRVICLDYNRGRVFLRISRVMEQILESSPKDMELDAFALSKMFAKYSDGKIMAHSILFEHLKMYGDPAYMIFYVDGFPTLEKKETHRERSARRITALKSAKVTINTLGERISRGKPPTKAIFKNVNENLRGGFTWSLQNPEDFVDFLLDQKQDACLCRSEANIVIAADCQPQDIVLFQVSDFFAYDSVKFIWRPVGKRDEAKVLEYNKCR